MRPSTFNMTSSGPYKNYGPPPVCMRFIDPLDVILNIKGRMQMRYNIYIYIYHVCCIYFYCHSLPLQDLLTQLLSVFDVLKESGCRNVGINNREISFMTE
jgi:hypothetical protein